MVNALSRITRATFVSVSLILSAAAKDVAEYRLGDKIAEDIVTPVQLLVVDPAATEALKDKESQRIPVVFRFNKTAAAVVDMDLRDKFAVARSNFVALMHNSFHHTKLEAEQLDTEQFDKLIASFKKRDKIFPITRSLAEEWALGGDGLASQTALFARIREMMEQPIRFDNLTNAPKIGSQVLLVPVKSDDETIGLADIRSRGTNVPKTNLLTMSRARLALLAKFSEEEADAARFAARCLVFNCFLEAELTLTARARHTEPLFVAETFQPGQTIAKHGQLVDRKLMAALTQLQEKTVAGRLQQQVTQGKTQVAEIRASNHWLFGGLIGAGAILIAVVTWLLLRRKTPGSMLPAVVGSTTSPAEAAWQERALVAEEKAARAHEAIRSGVMDQLKDKAVSSLASQRGEMMQAQQAAAKEMRELERRLNDLQAPLQDRLRAYESRIADLEKALTAKGEENRELIKAKIELMRKQLEAERGGSHLRFN